jgi:hypothetical protein
LIVIGAVAFLVSLTADLIGIGDDTGFQVGPRQASGIILGLLVALIGALILRRSRET